VAAAPDVAVAEVAAAAPDVAVAEVAAAAPDAAVTEAVVAALHAAVAEAVGLAAPAFFLSRDHLAALVRPRTRHRAARRALIQSLEPRRSSRPEAALLRSP